MSYLFKRGDHVELAQATADAMRGTAAGARVLGAEGQIWRYTTEGLYAPIVHGEQSRIVQAFAGAPVVIGEDRTRPLKLKAADVSGVLKLTYDAIEHVDYFNGAKAGLAFSDGFVEVTQAGIVKHDHSPDHRARVGYPFAYPGNAASTAWLAFLESLFLGDADAHEKIALLQEHAGACLVGLATRYQTALVLVGLGANGKSAYAEVLSRAMPMGSVCSVPPQEWDNEQKRAHLAGKLLNVCNELPEGDIIASEAFKAIVAGNGTNAKIVYRPPFDFHPRAGHLFAANSLPGTTDHSDGFWRRWAIERFNRAFKGAAADATIVERLVAGELPKIVAWALHGATRLVQTGMYTLPSSHHEELATWRGGADPVSQFLGERFPAREGQTPATAVYNAFVAWCEANGHRPMSSTKFGMRLGGLGIEGQHTKAGKIYALSAAVTGSIATRHRDSEGGTHGCN